MWKNLLVLFVLLVAVSSAITVRFQTSASSNEIMEGEKYYYVDNSPIDDDSKPCVNLRRFCTFEENNDHRLEIYVPNYTDVSTEGIGKMFGIHNSQWPEYQLPVELIWTSMGIGKYVQSPNLTACSSQHIRFDRRGSGNFCQTTDANFIWTGAAQTITNTATSPVPFWISVPAEVKGQVRVTGGYVSFMFQPGKAPILLAGDKTNPSFNDEIACLTLGTTHAVVRGRTNSGKAGHPVIIFKNK